jgi:hypothetical protein
MADVVSGLAVGREVRVARGHSDQSIDLDAVLEAADDNQVVKLLNLVLLQAIKDRASDIHFEPFETSSRCGTASTACSTRWCRRPSTWARRSRAA